MGMIVDIRDVFLQYGGEILQPGVTYDFGLGGQLECVVDGYPVEFITASFPSFDDNNRVLASDADVADVFPISSSFTDGNEYELACVAIHRQLRIPRQSDRITFTACKYQEVMKAWP